MRASFIALSLAVLTACSSEPREYDLTGNLMGTSFSVKIVSEKRPDLDALESTIWSSLQAVDRRMSTYRPDSELSVFNASESTNWQTVSDALCETVAAAIAIGKMTNGAFDVTVAPAVDLWGFGPETGREVPPGDAEVEVALAGIGYQRLESDCTQPAIRKRVPDVRVDLSGIAKGLAVDTVANLLDAAPVANYLVEVGGELRSRGVNVRGDAWGIGIEKPASTGRAVDVVVRLVNEAMATSGDYRNFFEYDGQRYSHTIDPRTGRPVTHGGASVTVIGDSTTAADALATALLVMGPDEGYDFATHHGIAAYFIARDDMKMTSRATPAFAEYL